MNVPVSQPSEQALKKLRNFASTILNIVDACKEKKSQKAISEANDPTFHVRIDVEKPVLQDKQVKLIPNNQSQRRRSSELSKNMVANLPFARQTTSNDARHKNSKSSQILSKEKTRNQLRNNDHQLNSSSKKHRQGFPASKITFCNSQPSLHERRLAPAMCKICLKNKMKENDPRLKNKHYLQMLHLRCLTCFLSINADGTRVKAVSETQLYSGDSVILSSSNDVDQKNYQTSHCDVNYRNNLHTDVVSVKEQTKNLISASIQASSDVVSTTKDRGSAAKKAPQQSSFSNVTSKCVSDQAPAISVGSSGASVAEVSKVPRDPRLKSRAQCLNIKRSESRKERNDAHNARQSELMRQLLKSPCKSKRSLISKRSKPSGLHFKRKSFPASVSAKILSKANVTQGKRSQTRNLISEISSSHKAISNAEDTVTSNPSASSISTSETTNLTAIASGELNASIKQENVSSELKDQSNAEFCETNDNHVSVVEKEETEQDSNFETHCNPPSPQADESPARREITTQNCQVSSNLDISSVDLNAAGATKDKDDSLNVNHSITTNALDTQKECFVEQTADIQTNACSPENISKEISKDFIDMDHPRSSLAVHTHADSGTSVCVDSFNINKSQDEPTVLPRDFFEDDLPTLNVKPTKRKRLYSRVRSVVTNEESNDAARCVVKDSSAFTDQASSFDSFEESSKRSKLDEKLTNVEYDNMESVSAPQAESFAEALDSEATKLNTQDRSIISKTLLSTEIPTNQKFLSKLVKHEIPDNVTVHLSSLPKHVNLQPTVKLIDAFKTSPTFQEKRFPIVESSVASLSSMGLKHDSSMPTAKLDSPMSPIVIYDSEEESQVALFVEKPTSTPNVVNSDTAKETVMTDKSKHEQIKESQIFHITTPPNSPHNSDHSQSFTYKNTAYHWPYSTPSVEEIQAMSDDEYQSDHSETKRDIIIPLIRLEESGYVPKCFLYKARGHSCCKCCTAFCCSSSWIKL